MNSQAESLHVTAASFQATVFLKNFQWKSKRNYEALSNGEFPLILEECAPFECLKAQTSSLKLWTLNGLNLSVSLVY